MKHVSRTDVQSSLRGKPRSAYPLIPSFPRYDTNECPFGLNSDSSVHRPRPPTSCPRLPLRRAAPPIDGGAEGGTLVWGAAICRIFLLRARSASGGDGDPLVLGREVGGLVDGVEGVYRFLECCLL